MVLASQLSENDGWKRLIAGVPKVTSTVIHFFFKGKRLCDSKEEVEGETHDNVPADRCQKCFERTRNLYNSDKIEDAYRDIS